MQFPDKISVDSNFDVILLSQIEKNLFETKIGKLFVSLQK